jgi:ABC-2 type transport system ATP-binding protein
LPTLENFAFKEAVMPSESSAVLANNLHKNYAHIAALRGLTLDVRQGEIFGLLGANGAGKTTLIKTIVGITAPTSGSVQVLGLHPMKAKQALRRQIGYMPQSPVLYEDLTARENLRFWAQAHHLADLDKRLDEVLDFVGLTSRQHDQVYGFSGGMKQRLSLACALAHQPRLLLLDEPTTGVDPKLRASFWKTFRQMADDGATILLSTHQMDEALYCDRLAVMRDGTVLACDTPQALLARGRTRVTLWQGDTVTNEALTNYAVELPRLLERFPAASITRVEVQQDTLETVILDMISAQTGEEQADELEHNRRDAAGAATVTAR